MNKIIQDFNSFFFKLSSGLFLFLTHLIHWGKYVHHMNALEKKVCTDICIIVALLPFYDARWLFATGVNTYASDTCFVFGCFPPPPFSVAHEWSGSYPSYLCGSLEIGANFIPWQHRLTTSLCWQTSPKSRPVGIGHGGGAGLVTVQFWTLTNESTVKTALQRASVFILSPIPATWDTSFCIDEHPLLSLVAWNKRAEPLWPPQVWSSTEN